MLKFVPSKGDTQTLDNLLSVKRCVNGPVESVYHGNLRKAISVDNIPTIYRKENLFHPSTDKLVAVLKSLKPRYRSSFREDHAPTIVLADDNKKVKNSFRYRDSCACCQFLRHHFYLHIM